MRIILTVVVMGIIASASFAFTTGQDLQRVDLKETMARAYYQEGRQGLNVKYIELYDNVGHACAELLNAIQKDVE